jgi:hypothetical protein
MLIMMGIYPVETTTSVKICANHGKKSSKFKKNHTCRWYDDTRLCKICFPKPTSSVSIQKSLRNVFFYISQTKSSLDKIFCKNCISSHHLDFFNEFRWLLYCDLYAGSTALVSTWLQSSNQKLHTLYKTKKKNCLCLPLSLSSLSPSAVPRWGYLQELWARKKASCVNQASYQPTASLPSSYPNCPPPPPQLAQTARAASTRRCLSNFSRPASAAPVGGLGAGAGR